MFSEPAHNLLPDSPAPPARLAAYAAAKSEALGLLDRLARLHPPVAAPCRALATKLAAERFDLAVVGEFKRGKSCLVNALLGENLLPTGVLPLTSVPVEIGHGGALAIEVRFDDGERLAIGRDQLADYATEAANPGNAKGVAAIRIAFPAPLLERGLRLVDTPGVGSAHRHNTLTTHAALPRCDAALFVLAADQPVGQAELDFLETVGVHAQRIFFALNKIDRLEDGDIGPVAGFARTVLERALGGPVRLFPVSARLALKGGGWMDPGLRGQSRLPALVAALETFLAREKGGMLLLGAADRTARLLGRARLELEISLQGLGLPPETLAEKLGRFRARRQDAQAALRGLQADYRARLERLPGGVLDPALPGWRTELERRLGGELAALAAGGADIPPRELDGRLAGFVAGATAEAAAWLAPRAEAALAGEAGAADRAFLAECAALVENLLGYAADLCGVEAPPPVPAPAWSPDPVPDSGPDTEVSGLEWLSGLAVNTGPEWLGRRFPRLGAVLARAARRRIVRRRRQDLLDAIDRALGRMRHACLRRLERERVRQAAAAGERLDSAAAGIEQAFRAGIERGSRAVGAMEARRQTLAELNRLGRDVARLRQRAEGLGQGDEADPGA